MQKRAKNLAAEELLIEVMADREWKFCSEAGLNIPITDLSNIESIFLSLMFGWGSASLLPSYK